MLFYFMHRFNMSNHDTLLTTSVVTNVTSKWFISLMSCSYVFSQSYSIWVSLPHISHLNNFFPSYFDEIFLLDFFRTSSFSIFLFNILTVKKEGNYYLVSVTFHCYENSHIFVNHATYPKVANKMF